MAEKKSLPMFHPMENPYRGLFSKPSSVTLGNGAYSVSKNWRFEEGIPRVRFPMTREAGWGAFSGKATGAKALTVNGREMIMLVSNASGQIYSISATGVVSTVSSSDSAAKYGDTRMNNGTDDQCCFTVIRDSIAEKEYVVISDGVGVLRVYDPTSTVTDGKVAYANPITPPSSATLGVVPTFPKYFALSSNANTNAYATGGSGFTGADAGTTTDNYAILTATTSVTSPGTGTDYVELEMTTTTDFSDCPQLIIYIETTYAPFAESLKISMGEGASAPVTVYDPSAVGIGTAPTKVQIDSTKWLLVYDLANVPTASRNAVDTIRFGWAGTSDPPAANAVFNIYGVFGSGKVRGNALHAYTYRNSGSRVESRGFWVGPENVTPEFTKNLGCRATLNTRLPNDPRIFYQYNVNFQNTSTAQRNLGVDELVIYRADGGEDYAWRSYLTTVTLAAWTPGSPGSWSFSSGSAESIVTYNDNNDVNVKNTSLYAPDDLIEPPPSHANWMCSTSERLFLATFDQSGSSDPAYSALWASDVFAPMRFRRFHNADEDGTRFALQGETLTGMLPAPSGIYGVSVIFAWTDKRLYKFAATSAGIINQWVPVSEFGTLTPYSIAAGGGDIYWLDQYKNVRRLRNGQVENLSEQTIQDKLDTICGGASTGWNYITPLNQRLAFGGWFKGRYYLSVDQAGTGSLNADTEEPLVYDSRIWHGSEIGWVEDDLGGSTYSTRYWCPMRSKLYVISKDSKIYRYEDPDSAQATDGYYYTGSVPGTGYSATLKTGAMFPGMRGGANGMVVMFHDIMCDDVASGTVTYTNTYLPGGEAPTQTASVDHASASITWCTSTVPSDAGGRGIAVSCQLVTPTGSAGQRLYGWRAQYIDQEFRPISN